MSANHQLEIDWIRLLAEQRLSASAKRVAEIQRRAQDRDDLAGVNLLLRMLSLMVSRTESLIAGSLRSAENSQGRRRERELDTVRTAIVQLERALSGTCKTLVAPPERDVAALIQPYVRLAKVLTGNEGTELIFESDEYFEYEVWADVFEEIREGVQIVAPDLELPIDDLPPFALITYPGRADSETLLHAVIAHEVIHLGLVRKRETGESQVKEIFVAKARALKGGDTEDQDADSQRRRRLESWLNECLADTLALRIIGPAFFFALVEYLLPTHISPGSVGAADDGHPSPVWRMQRLLPDAARFFVDRSGKRGDAADVYERFLSLIPRSSRGQDGTELEDQELLEEMIEEIDLDGLAGAATYPIDRFRRDVPLVWEKLEQNIAPVERVKGRRTGRGRRSEDKAPLLKGDPDPELPQTEWSESIDWRSIMNGGYLHYLHHSLVAGSPQASLGELRQKANALIRGSIELSELHRRMIELQTEFRVLEPVRGE